MTSTFESYRLNSWRSITCEILSSSNLHAIAEEFLNKYHLEGRTVTTITVTASSATYFLASATNRSGSYRWRAFFSVLTWFGFEAQSVVLNDREMRWKGHQGDDPSQGFTPTRKGVMFRCQGLFHSDISKEFW